jgi:hypothetical protein
MFFTANEPVLRTAVKNTEKTKRLRKKLPVFQFFFEFFVFFCG